MSPTTLDTTPDRETLERQADLARDRLAHTLAELDEKRQALSKPRELVVAELRSHALPLIAVASGALIALATGAIVGIVHARSRAKHPWLERRAALVRAWEHPERTATYRRPPLPSMLGQKVLATVATVAAGELVRRLARRMAA